MIIWGENDPAHSARESAELAALLHEPEIHHLASSGHFPMLDEPQIVTPLVSDFIEY